MILKTGEKLHVIHRRRYEGDLRRHFAGVVEHYENGLARVVGHTFVTDEMNKHRFVRRDDRRVKILALCSGELIVNVLPPHVDMAAVRYELDHGQLVVTDGNWKMNVKEFGSG